MQKPNEFLCHSKEEEGKGQPGLDKLMKIHEQLCVFKAGNVMGGH